MPPSFVEARAGNRLSVDGNPPFSDSGNPNLLAGERRACVSDIYYICDEREPPEMRSRVLETRRKKSLPVGAPWEGSILLPVNSEMKKFFGHHLTASKLSSLSLY